MMRSKKGTELPLNVIIVLIIVLVVLVIVLMFFTGIGQDIFQALKGQAGIAEGQVKDLPLP